MASNMRIKAGKGIESRPQASVATKKKRMKNMPNTLGIWEIMMNIVLRKTKLSLV